MALTSVHENIPIYQLFHFRLQEYIFVEDASCSVVSCTNTCDTTFFNGYKAVGMGKKFSTPLRIYVCVHPVKRFDSYSWNTGAASPAINLHTHGLYTLTVTDDNSCTGTDSTRIQTKNCPHTIFFPNAFSPNHDGYNDIYRPRITGDIVHYSVRIFNRFGQLVFSSTDDMHGWDGTSGGNLQPPGAYPYTCNWQFAGDPPSHQKAP